MATHRLFFSFPAMRQGAGRSPAALGFEFGIDPKFRSNAGAAKWVAEYRRRAVSVSRICLESSLAADMDPSRGMEMRGPGASLCRSAGLRSALLEVWNLEFQVFNSAQMQAQ
jgi:hypothetical protein